MAFAGCVRHSTPDNFAETLYAPEQTAGQAEAKLQTLSYANEACPPPGTANFLMPFSRGKRSKVGAWSGGNDRQMRYSPGDRFNVSVFGGNEFSGDYVVSADGQVTLAFAGQVQVAGLSNAELLKAVERAYVRAGIFTDQGAKISVRPVQYAPINVTVSGAVFFPGRYAIGGIKDSDKTDRVMNRFGDNPLERFVPAGIRAAGGVRPDADVSSIRVTRKGRTFTLDWRGAVTGAPVDDMPLIEGDHIEVNESGCFQSALVRPSQITPPGIRVVFSNLSAPAYGNAASIQSYQFAGSVPYGTRLLQAVVQANCVGGTFTTNAHRHVVLITRNPRTMQTEVIQRAVEALVRNADRDSYNPFIMPDDAIACYDSTMTELRDVLSLANAAVLPANTLRGAFPPR
jgi:polysaccharide export outer membrane protein